jgi:protein-L-isoaspartate(D-aspartate) O-methyltransferase
VIEGDGSKGLARYKPYDRIYATCSAPAVPQILINQLAMGGKLIIPVGKTFSRLLLIEKNKTISETDLGGCAFVPMIGDEGYEG